VLANVALPEVQKVHVVDRRLAALDFEQDARRSDATKVVRSKGQLLAREEANFLVLEPKLACELSEGLLYSGAAGPRLVGFSDPGRRLACVQMPAESVRKDRDL